MEVGDKVTVKKKTFTFGHSKSAVIIPAVLNIPAGSEVSLTIELINKPN